MKSSSKDTKETCRAISIDLESIMQLNSNRNNQRKLRSNMNNLQHRQRGAKQSKLKTAGSDTNFPLQRLKINRKSLSARCCKISWGCISSSSKGAKQKSFLKKFRIVSRKNYPSSKKFSARVALSNSPKKQASKKNNFFFLRGQKIAETVDEINENSKQCLDITFNFQKNNSKNSSGLLEDEYNIPLLGNQGKKRHRTKRSQVGFLDKLKYEKRANGRRARLSPVKFPRKFNGRRNKRRRFFLVKDTRRVQSLIAGLADDQLDCSGL